MANAAHAAPAIDEVVRLDRVRAATTAQAGIICKRQRCRTLGPEMIDQVIVAKHTHRTFWFGIAHVHDAGRLALGGAAILLRYRCQLLKKPLARRARRRWHDQPTLQGAQYAALVRHV